MGSSFPLIPCKQDLLVVSPLYPRLDARRKPKQNKEDTKLVYIKKEHAKLQSFNALSPFLTELSLILELKPISSDNFLSPLKQKYKIKYQKTNRN